MNIMDIVEFPILCQWSYVGIAVVWSLIQGVAGYWYGLFIYDSYAVDKYVRPKWVKGFAYGFHHGAFYFICSISGFLAWYLALQFAAKIKNSSLSEVAGGTATILTAFFLISVLGVSGALPRILFLGKNPIKS